MAVLGLASHISHLGEFLYHTSEAASLIQGGKVTRSIDSGLTRGWVELIALIRQRGIMMRSEVNRNATFLPWQLVDEVSKARKGRRSASCRTALKFLYTGAYFIKEVKE